MTQFVGVDYCSHRLYEAIDDIERYDDHGVPGGIKQQRSRLTVDLHVTQGGRAKSPSSQ
jgi:hypothetical protein